jgi:SAM-dependent methyltransferase
MSRRNSLLQGLDIGSMRGLEIGPLTAAVVGKDEGRVEYVDHLDTEALRKKYADAEGIDASLIPQIDHVLEEGRLPASLIGGDYDYIIASHVFEHLPNPLGWLRECAAILRPGGCLSLVVPDKRFTFDLCRPLTTLAELIDSDRNDQRKPSTKQIFEAATCSARLEAGITWQRPPRPEELHPEGADVDAFGVLKAEEGWAGYLDVHCTIYTPSSFLTLMARSARLDRHPFSLTSFHDTERNSIEFCLQLANTPELEPEQRAESFLKMLSHCEENPEPWRASGVVSGNPLLRLQGYGKELKAKVRPKIQSIAAGLRERKATPHIQPQAVIGGREQASGRHWDQVLAQGTSGLRLHWWEDPTTIRHINRLVSGQALDDLHEGFHQRILELLPAGQTTIRALSVGCGTGSKEMALIEAAAGRFSFEFRCFDVAPAAIEAASEQARTKGLDAQISFTLADAFHCDLDGEWDLVYWNNALQHMLDTHRAIQWSRDRLKTGGLLAIDDYVGPNQFQWSDATIQRATELLQTLPARYLTDPTNPTLTLRTAGGKPPLQSVIATDPTEAVDSKAIIPALQQAFPNSLDLIPTGGLAYLICLDGLFENFKSPEELRSLQELLDQDAAWGRDKETAYAVAFARKTTP